MTGSALDLGFVFLLAAWAAGVGLRLTRRLGGLPGHATDALALALPLGLGALSLAVLAIGQVGWLTPQGIAGVLLAGTIVAWGGVPFRGLGPSLPRESDRSAVDHETKALGRLFDLALAAVVGGSLLTALAPVTDGDALCYHLQVPRIFLAAGSVGFEPDLHETVYPLITEMLYAVTLALRGPVACRLVQWLLGLIFAANVTALARPVLGDRARWAGAIALLAPAVSNGMAAPLNDVALAAFAAAALHATVRWLDAPSAARAALAGVSAGLALGVKYPALVWVGWLSLAIGARGPRRHAVVFALTALVVGGPWYGRADWFTGNPVYPFFRDVFGAGLEEVLDPSSLPMRVTLSNLLAAPALMTLWPERFDSFAHQIGPVFLMLLPALFVIRPPRRVAGLVLLGWAFLTVCLTKRQSPRFLLAALGPWSVAAAWVASEVARSRTLAARCVAAILAGVLVFESAIAVGHARHGIAVVLGRESAEAYLARREPTFVVGRWIEAHLPATARLVGQDHRGFYLARPYTMELAHRRRTGLAAPGEAPEAIVARLRSAGFTHLLMCPPIPETAVEFDPTLGRALAPWLAAGTPLYHEDLADADGVVRRYALYDLSRPPEVAERERRGPR